MNATTVDFNLGSSQWPYVERGGGVHIARLMGSLLPPESWDDSHETLRMCASYSSAVLRVAHFPDSNDTSIPIQNAHLVRRLLLASFLLKELTEPCSESVFWP